MRILFVTWDGPEVNYLESLFLPIFVALRDKGIEVDVLQFRWGSRKAADGIARACVEAGIGYRPVFTKRRPVAIGPFASAVGGSREVRRAVRVFGSDIIMPRSLMPALAVLAAGGRRLRPILFDADGLEADERTDFRGLSKFSPIYLALRAVERRMARESDAVVVRTSAAAKVLSERTSLPADKFHVVANGRDPEVFEPGTPEDRERLREKLGVSKAVPLMVYAGSVGPQYRFDLIAAHARAVQSAAPGAHLSILTGTPAAARQALEKYAPDVLEFTSIARVAASEVPDHLAAADVGFAFRSVSFSARAIAPVKLGEYLLCGVPVIGTAAVGETAPAVGAGVFLDEAAGAHEGARWVLESVLSERDEKRADARSVGIAHFSLKRSVDDYLGALAAMQPSTS